MQPSAKWRSLLWHRPRSVAAEAVGTAFLLIAVVGSGILGERLCGGNIALALLANALATGAALFALIEWFAPLSGAHFNPLVTLMFVARGDIRPGSLAAYVPAQMLGAIVGVGIADAMFGEPIYAISVHARSGASQWLSEFVSTFGLIGAVYVCSRLRPSSISGVVATYIGGAFWFTATDFANPAVTVARAFTNTFAAIRPCDVPGFLIAQTFGALAAAVVFHWLTSAETDAR